MASEMIKRASEEEQVSGLLGILSFAPRIVHCTRRRNDVKRLKRERRRSASVFSQRQLMTKYKRMLIGTR